MLSSKRTKVTVQSTETKIQWSSQCCMLLIAVSWISSHADFKFLDLIARPFSAPLSRPLVSTCLLTASRCEQHDSWRKNDDSRKQRSVYMVVVSQCVFRAWLYRTKSVTGAQLRRGEHCLRAGKVSFAYNVIHSVAATTLWAQCKHDASVLLSVMWAFKLYKGISSSACSSFFSERLINHWNHLPDSVDFTSLLCFKRSLDTVDFSLLS